MRSGRGAIGRWLLAASLAIAAAPTATGQEAGPEVEPPAERVVEAIGEPPVGAEAGDEGAAIDRVGILDLFRDANPMLIPLVLCSIVTVGLTLERLVATRRRRVLPRDFTERFLERLASGKLDRDRAAELCRAHESPVARVFAHAIRYWGQPAATIRQAVDADAAGEVADLKRNVRALNGTATLAPLLGLLGTVIGLIEAFDALGGATGDVPKGEALAHGISLALVATAFGLVVAVASVVAYYWLLNRIDLLVRDLDEQARRVIDLISAEPWAIGDRRVGIGIAAADRARPESRAV